MVRYGCNIVIDFTTQINTMCMLVSMLMGAKRSQQRHLERANSVLSLNLQPKSDILQRAPADDPMNELQLSVRLQRSCWLVAYSPLLFILPAHSIVYEHSTLLWCQGADFCSRW